MATLSKTQIDRLGDRLKEGYPDDKDVQLLEEYRGSFKDACNSVINDIIEHLQIEPTGRPAKTIPSIIQKLRRESIRLSQIQDIAGCRIVVPNVSKQDDVVTSLRSVFPVMTIVDRRSKPSHGYRAVHLIATISDKLVEIQVRTRLQHFWAELSEYFSDVYNPGLKYGIGDAQSLALLKDTSDIVDQMETVEKMISDLEGKFIGIQTRAGISPGLSNELNTIRLQLVRITDENTRAKETLLSVFGALMAGLKTQKEVKS